MSVLRELTTSALPALPWQRYFPQVFKAVSFPHLQAVRWSFLCSQLYQTIDILNYIELVPTYLPCCILSLSQGGLAATTKLKSTVTFTPTVVVVALVF